MALLGILLTLILPLQADEIVQPKPNKIDTALSNVVRFPGVGTGFVVRYRYKKAILTNWHVCKAFDADKGKILDTTGKVIKFRKPFKVSKMYDLCLISVTTKSYGIELDHNHFINQTVFSAGYPSGQPLTYTEGKVTNSVLVTLNFPVTDFAECPYDAERIKESDRLYCGIKMRLADTSMKGRDGCSGSPVVNEHGKLVGIVNSVNEERPGKPKLSMVPVEHIVVFLQAAL